jgi:glutamyl-tRNA reductase
MLLIDFGVYCIRNHNRVRMDSEFRQLICVGLNHKTASIKIRERAAIPSALYEQLLRQVGEGQIYELAELVILSTCNRLEFYIAGRPDTSRRALIDMLLRYSALSEDELAASVYWLAGDACVEHLMRVATGLDSQVLGEPQILGQITDAYQEARASGATGAVLSQLMQRAIHTGKRVRSETDLGKGALSISSIALANAERILGKLNQRVALIVGTGEMARKAAVGLAGRGIRRLMIANRTLDHAQALAETCGGAAIPFIEIGQALIETDVVISAVNAPHALITADDIATIKRDSRILVLFDLALPRNIDPAVGKLPGVQLFNLDDLQAVSQATNAERERAIPPAEAIVTEESQAFARWLSSRKAVPAIRQLRSRADKLRQAELDHLLSRLPDLNERDRELLERFSQRLVNKLLHEPMLKLKEQASESALLELVDDPFDVVDLDFDLEPEKS